MLQKFPKKKMYFTDLIIYLSLSFKIFQFCCQIIKWQNVKYNFISKDGFHIS